MKRHKWIVNGILTLCVAFGAAGCQSRGHPAPQASHKSPSHTNSTGNAPSKSGGTSGSSAPSQPGESGIGSSQVDNVWEIQQTDPPLQNHPVNGCEPYGSVLSGFCISTYPIWTQSSAGMTLWSGIEVGATVEIKGATIVSAKSLKPYFSAVAISGPGGFMTSLPVAPNGGYDGNVTFTRAGQYQMGVVLNGQQQQGLSFSVSYVPHPQTTANLGGRLPGQSTPASA